MQMHYVGPNDQKVSVLPPQPYAQKSILKVRLERDQNQKPDPMRDGYHRKQKSEGKKQKRYLRCMHHRPRRCITIDLFKAMQHSKAHGGKVIKVAITVNLI
jgi:hypothetical protein